MIAIPLLTTLYTGIINSIQAQLEVVIPAKQKNFLRALAGTWATQMNALYRNNAFNQKNVWFDTADPPSMGGTLYRFGQTFLQRPPYAATEGNYTCSVTGTAGAVISANTTYLSDPTSLSPGYLYILDNDYTLTGTDDVILLRATVAGSISDLAVGNTLACTQPLVNVGQAATVTIISVAPVDGETDDQYRAAIATQVQLSPQGGAVADYITWAAPVAGVSRVYPYTSEAATWEVDVFIEAILSDSGGTAPDYNYGIPTGTILTNATDAILADPITSLARKPMGVVLGPASIGAIAVTVYQVTIAFTGTSGMTAAQKQLITEALQQAVSNIRPFIPGAGVIAEQNDTISINLPASGGQLTAPEKYVVVVIAIQAAPGAIFTGVTMTVNSISETSHTFDNGFIPYLKASNVTFS